MGDVLKHVAWLEALSRTRGLVERAIVDTHAGRGRYGLGPTGEWTEALGVLLALSAEARRDAPACVQSYLHAVEAEGAPRSYPGSAVLAARVRGGTDRLILAEAVEETRAALVAAVPEAEVHPDGLALLRTVPPGLASTEAVVLIDPPFADRSEWEQVPDAVAASVAAWPSARYLLWYPVKSHARPNAMIERLKRAGVAHVVVELLTAPLDFKKNRLNGSGLVLVRPPPGLVETLVAAASWLGPRLSVRDGYWNVRVQGSGDVR